MKLRNKSAQNRALEMPDSRGELISIKLANIAGVALIFGTALMIKNRRAKTDQASSYFDWYLIYLAFFLGVTGMGAQLTRLAGLAFVSFATYYVHLVLIFCLFAYLPFTKLAHLVYRTVAMAYAEYSGRGFKIG